MSEGGGPGLVLRAAEGLFRLGSWMYHHPFDSGWRRQDVLAQPVMSVGNLTAGGTGKTPVAAALAEALRQRGLRPAILSRGYRARRRHGVLRAGAWADGKPASARDAGDEPFLLSIRLPEVPVVIGKDRFREASALTAGGTTVDVWILDDGFQHRRLHRDLDVVLLDAASPLGNGRQLPAGPLREPAGALSRAGIVLLTGGDPSSPVPASTRDLLAQAAPRALCLRSWVEVESTRRLHGGSGRAAVVPLAGAAIWAVSGIARPERFHDLLEASGAEIRGRTVFPDHHPFTEAEVRELALEAERAGAMPVTTEKDAVRLRELRSPPGTWWVVAIRPMVEGGWDGLLDRVLPGEG